MPRATAQSPPPHDWELVGRSREVATVDAFLDDVAALPSALRLVGEPGIGKSTIWNYAVHAADPGLVYASSVSGEVYRSADGGQAWEKLAREFGEVRALAWAPL